MASKATTPKPAVVKTPTKTAAQIAAEAATSAATAERAAILAAVETLDVRITEAMEAIPGLSERADAGIAPSTEQAIALVNSLETSYPGFKKMTGLQKLEDKAEKEADKDKKDSERYTRDEMKKAIAESHDDTLKATWDYQNKMIHWNAWHHRNTRTLVVGLAAGVVLTIAIPKLVGWARGSNEEIDIDSEMDVVSFEAAA